MELLYNPNEMPEEEVKATFVARQHLVDELLSLIEQQPDGAGVQHVVIIAPRGMGKTTVLLMVQFAVRDSGLSARWQTVKFPEESYGIYDLADLWIEVLDHLATATSDEALREKIASLKIKYPDNDDLQEAALAVIKDWRKKHGRRLVLLVDNFDMILEQINDERDNARLREVLMNDGTIMLAGGATTFFHEARAYDQPLYNFFKIYDLERLKFEEMQDLLRRRAEADGRTDFEAKLQANIARLRTLEYFTGGNPRLVIMLYRVVTLSDLTDARRGLEKLLDEATPFYKHKTESLPPQQRKILDYIARESSRTFEGVTPTQVAEATRMTANQASAQLKRLAELGYVQTANLRRRSTFYVLSERLYAIWYKMRFGRDARQRMGWLVDFMKQWYEAEEIRAESSRLDGLFREHLSAGRLREAGKTLEFKHCLDLARGEESLTPDLLTSLPPDTLDYLRQAGWINEKQIIQAKTPKLSSDEAQVYLARLVAMGLVGMAREAYLNGQMEQAIPYLDKALELAPDLFEGWCNRGVVLYRIGKYEEAIASYDRALEAKPDDYEAWYFRGNVFEDMGKHEEAIDSFDRALEIKQDFYEAWYNRGNILARLNRFDEAIKSYDRALQIEPDKDKAWNNRGNVLHKLGRREEAIESLDRALEIKPNKQEAWFNRGFILAELGRFKEAIVCYDHALDIKPDDQEAWFNRTLAGLRLFISSLNQDDKELAKRYWDLARSSSDKIEGKTWFGFASWALWQAAKSGHLEFARQLISESDLEEPLFPLARAIDYLLTQDEALIEKLSPEVRGIVEEIVAKLGNSSGETPRAQPTARKKKTTKQKSGPRSRVRKQLA